MGQCSSSPEPAAKKAGQSMRSQQQPSKAAKAVSVAGNGDDMSCSCDDDAGAQPMSGGRRRSSAQLAFPAFDRGSAQDLQDALSPLTETHQVQRVLRRTTQEFARDSLSHRELLAAMVTVGIRDDPPAAVRNRGAVDNITFEDERALEDALFDASGELKGPCIGLLLMWQHAKTCDRPVPKKSSSALSHASTAFTITSSAVPMSGGLPSPRWGVDEPCNSGGIDPRDATISPTAPLLAALEGKGAAGDSPPRAASESPHASTPVPKRAVSDPPAFARINAAASGWGTLLQGLRRSELEEVGLVVRKSLRSAVERYLSLVRRRHSTAAAAESEQRKAEVLRDGTWWSSLAQCYPSQILSDVRLQTFLRWRRRNMGDIPPDRLVPPIDTVDPGTGRVRYTAVLDLDETLIYARGPDADLSMRPGSRELLRTLQRLGWSVVVWTSSTHDYSSAVLSNVDPEHEWFHECVYRHPRWLSRRRDERDLAATTPPAPREDSPPPTPVKRGSGILRKPSAIAAENAKVRQRGASAGALRAARLGVGPRGGKSLDAPGIAASVRHKGNSTDGARSKSSSHPLKDLQLLGRDLDYTVLVDNSVACCAKQLDTNAVLVPDYEGLESKDTLHRLRRMFESLDESQLTVPDYLRTRSKPFLTRMDLDRGDGVTVAGYVVDGASTTEMSLAVPELAAPLPYPPTPHQSTQLSANSVGHESTAGAGREAA